MKTALLILMLFALLMLRFWDIEQAQQATQKELAIQTRIALEIRDTIYRSKCVMGVNYAPPGLPGGQP